MRPTYSRIYTRRHFLGSTASAAFAFTLLPSRVWGANERLRIAGIGVGGKGSGDIDQAAAHGDVVALCDCDDNSLQSKLKKFPGAKTYFDFRELFDQMGDKIDAVTISTPDHNHALAAALAMKHGIHVYVQKPLTHDVWEARWLRDLARKKKLATQMGNQGTASDGLRRGVEVLRAGAIGPVREIHVWTNRPVWPQAPEITARPTGLPPIPANVHWDQFLGTAPYRPYNEAYHPFKWRGWWDFGTGALGDMGCHTANLPFMALELDYPTTIRAESETPNPETYPGWATVYYEFAPRGSRPAVRFTWYEGKLPNGQKNLPPLDLFHGEKPADSGSLMVGSKGVMYSPSDYGGEWKLLPSNLFVGYVDPTPTLPRNGKSDQGMKDEWVAAIRGGPKALSNFDYASMLTETILLGNVAIRAGTELKWDGPDFRFTSGRAAKKFLKRDYRKGWRA
ncbi:MAG TPA: Gfo/Idh/MocA family oxidoreductase [Verrucomicrobiota bacterium]|nr:dehydrogenase [Verrucomicrobiales bacterium]HRI11374.1 Gfo/Idh/MocA family oxidoreductase [Verrucomicrobiota bacterium]